jgi:hypothetical protein
MTMSLKTKAVGGSVLGAVVGGAALLLLNPGACNNTEACLSWSASKYSDNSTIPPDVTVLYTVYRSPNPGLLGSMIVTQTTARQLKVTGLPPGVWYFAVAASVDGMQSALSTAVSKQIRKPAPTDGAIERPTDGALEPRN